MKTIIAGSRDFNDAAKLKEVCDKLVIGSVISGCAAGADTLGAEWAAKNGKELILMPADWKKHGKSAGMIRNTAMARQAEQLVAFWDGRSPGTKQMISVAKMLGLKVHIIKY